MKMIGVIPARYASTRFPAKPLALLLGKPMIQWVIESAKKSRLLSEIIVATDHHDIARAAEKAGARAVMTDPNLPSGTDRIFAATRDLDFDVILNVQGDEPLLEATVIDQLASLFLQEPNLDMATAAHPISPEELQSMNAVKVVLNHRNEALYFSRYPIPYSRVKATAPLSACLKHIGMYAYSRGFLRKFCEAPPAEIEIAESLEQLRALHLGAKIKVLRVAQASPGVDTPEDLAKVETILRGK